MSSSIENRVVDMTFRNDAFERNAANTMGTLDKLKGKLNFDGSRKSAEELQGAVSKFSMSGMAGQIQGAASSFSAMSVVGITALATLTSKAVSAGLDIAKALTIKPALDGLREYETNLNSIQTVLANTSSKGTTLDQVNGALEELNAYSDKTIYNFAEMAKNIGTFTAAGVDLDTSVASIKGIANLAAVSGSTSEQASTAMYQLSQALAAGKVSLMDWNSVVNAGMGGQVFQDAIKETARVHGVAVDDIIKEAGSFRDSLQEGWITGDILNETLMKFTGDLNAEQLKTMGYTEEQIAGIIKMGETATSAATKVKTFSQLTGTLQEAMGSGWSKTFQIIVGDFEEAKEFFTGLNDVLSGEIGAGADARNALLQGWSDLGGRQVLIEAFWNILNAGISIIKQVKAAFRDVFPARDAQNLVDMTARFRDFTKLILDGTGQLAPFTRILKGFFAAFGIGWQFVKALVGAIGDLFGTLNGSGTSGFVEFLGGISDWLVRMKTSGAAAEAFARGFERINAAIVIAVNWLKELGSRIKEILNSAGFQAFAAKFSEAIKGIFSGNFDMEKVKAAFAAAGDVIRNSLSKIKDELVPMGGALDKAKEKLKEWGAKLGELFGPLGEQIKTQLGVIKDAIFSGLAEGDFTNLAEILATGFLGGLFIAIRKIIKNGLSLDLSGGLFESVTESMESLSGVLQGMQTNIKADTLLKIAAAVGILALSILALSNIDPEKLAKALTGIAVGMGQLVAAMAVLNLIGTGGGFIKLPFIAAGMVLLAGAVALLSVAVKSMSDMDWDELGRGMAGIAAGLGLLTGAMLLLSGSSGGILRASLAMIPMAKGLRLMADAVKEFAGMDWSTMARGMVGVGVGLGAITLALRNMPPNIRANALGLVVIAGALKILSSAVSSFGGIPWDVMARGMAGVAAALGIITAAMRLMPKNIMAQATALIAVGIAMNILAKALSSMGSMSWEEIGKGMVVLAGSLGILAVALKLMTGTGLAAAALTAVVVALGLFVPILVVLGALPWPVILTALGALAGLFAVIGVAGLLISPVIPALLGLAIAMGIFGAAVFAFGAGALLAATALGILVAAGGAGIALLVQLIGAVVAQIPVFLTAVAEGLVGMVTVIADNAPVIIAAMVKIAEGLLQAVIDLAPKAGEAIGVVLDTLLGVIVDNFPKLVQAGADLLVQLLQGIADNIGDVLEAAKNVIVEFLKGISELLPDVIQAGWDLLIDFVDGITNSVESNLSRLITAGGELVAAIIDGFLSGLANAAGAVWEEVKGFFSNILSGVKDFFGIASPSKVFIWIGEMLMNGLEKGVHDTGDLAVREVDKVSNNVMDKVSDTMGTLPNMFSGLADIRPTITPVLNLSSVQSEARKLNGLLAPSDIDAKTALSQAQAISQIQADMAATTAETSSEPTILFEQNNHSPRALSTVDIYRDTRSLLNSVKKELSIP